MHHKDMERRAQERLSANWKVVHLSETGGSGEPIDKYADDD